MNASDDNDPSCSKVAEILQELRDQYPHESLQNLQERFSFRAKSKSTIREFALTDVERTCNDLYTECLREGRPIPDILRKPS
jgi:hypothetical protein